MQIRTAGKGDIVSINRIYNQAVEEKFCTAHLEPVNLEHTMDWFRAHDPLRFPVFVAEKDHHVVGWISLGPYRPGREALEHVAEVSYYVDRIERGKGVGHKLMDHVIRLAPEWGYSVLIAILLDRNSPSLALLRRYGFTEWGSMPGIARIGNQVADHLYFGRKL